MLRKLLAAILWLSIAILSAAQVPITPPKPTLIKAGRILDVRTGKYLLTSQGILVEDGRIKQVAAFADLQDQGSKDAVTVDLSKAAVLPGLLDCHAHLLIGASAVNPHNNQATLTVLLLVYVILCVRSFIAARGSGKV